MLEITEETQKHLDHLNLLSSTKDKIDYIHTLPNPAIAEIGMASETLCREITEYANKHLCKHPEWCRTHNNKDAQGKFCDICASNIACKTCGWTSKYEYCSAYCEPEGT